MITIQGGKKGKGPLSVGLKKKSQGVRLGNKGIVKQDLFRRKRKRFIHEKRVRKKKVGGVKKKAKHKRNKKKKKNKRQEVFLTEERESSGIWFKGEEEKGGGEKFIGAAEGTKPSGKGKADEQTKTKTCGPNGRGRRKKKRGSYSTFYGLFLTKRGEGGSIKSRTAFENRGEREGFPMHHFQRGGKKGSAGTHEKRPAGDENRDSNLTATNPPKIKGGKRRGDLQNISFHRRKRKRLIHYHA